MSISAMRVEYDHLSADLGEGLTEGEYYFWQQQKRKQNLAHRAMGHPRFCDSCRNCLCDDPKRFRCICASGKIWVTPYRIRPKGVINR